MRKSEQQQQPKGFRVWVQKVDEKFSQFFLLWRLGLSKGANSLLRQGTELIKMNILSFNLAMVYLLCTQHTPPRILRRNRLRFGSPAMQTHKKRTFIARKLLEAIKSSMCLLSRWRSIKTDQMFAVKLTSADAKSETWARYNSWLICWKLPNEVVPIEWNFLITKQNNCLVVTMILRHHAICFDCYQMSSFCFDAFFLPKRFPRMGSFSLPLSTVSVYF